MLSLRNNTGYLPIQPAQQPQNFYSTEPLEEFAGNEFYTYSCDCSQYSVPLMDPTVHMIPIFSMIPTVPMMPMIPDQLFLEQARSNAEIFLSTCVVQLSDGEVVFCPNWSLSSQVVSVHQPQIEVHDHSFTNYTHSLQSSRSSSPASDSGSLGQLDLTNWTLPTSGNDERKNSLCEFGEYMFGAVLIVSPGLLRGDSGSYDRLIKVLAKPSSLSLMLEFLKATDFSNVIKAAVIKGAQGVSFYMEFDTSEALQALKEILEESYADLEKNTQTVQLNPKTFSVTGPVYKHTKLAYAIYVCIKAILQFKCGEKVIEHTLGKFGELNLRQLDWQGIEKSFGNQDAQSVAERHSEEDLMEMTDLVNKLKFRLKLLEAGNDFQMIQQIIQQVLSRDVNNLTSLHRVVETFKRRFAIDPTAKKRKEIMNNCKKEIAEKRSKGHVQTNEQRLAKLQKEEADSNRKAKEKSKSFMEKNSLESYKVLHLECEYNGKALAEFDKALEKEDGERERVYHILMAEIEKNKLDESVTQSKTEKKKVSTRKAKQRKRYSQSPRKNRRRNKQR